MQILNIRRFGLVLICVLVLPALLACSDSNSQNGKDSDGDLDSSEAAWNEDGELDTKSELAEEEIEFEEDGDRDVEAELDMELEEVEPELEWEDPGLDSYYGSLAYQAAATGFFRVEEIGGQWWLITPDGHPFFSNGINVVNWSGTCTHDGVCHYRETCTEKYGDSATWSDAQIPRMEEWGWNTVGAWSSYNEFVGRFPYTIIVYNAGVNWEVVGDTAGPLDFFTEAFAQRVSDAIGNVVPNYVDDPWLIGYYFDNEMHWGKDFPREGVSYTAHLFDEYFKKDIAASPGKERLLAFLQESYTDLASLAVDFEFVAADWAALGLLSKLKSRGTEGAEATRAAWTGVVAERYFGLIDTAFRAIDSNHMNLGTRFVSQLSPKAALEVCGRYADVVTINFYDLTDGLADVLSDMDPDYCKVDDYLRCHHEASGKPIMITEWGFRARDAGLPNSYPPIYPILDTQVDRADAYENKMREILARPWLVGQHWFLYADQPPEGRFDGEDNNFGLVTEADVPYDVLVERSAMMHGEIYKRLLGVE